MDRLVEQGFDFASVFFGDVNLPSSRKIEFEISQRFGIEENMSFSDKVEEMFHSSKEDDAKKLYFLREISKEILELFGRDGLKSFRILNLSNFYFYNDLSRVELVVDNYTSLDGKISGFKGDLLFVEIFGENALVNASNLVGRKILFTI
ncbi:MAG: hypothetical protein ACTSR0_03560 [Candidatus Asgardarchaeia archaeon]